MDDIPLQEPITFPPPFRLSCLSPSFFPSVDTCTYILIADYSHIVETMQKPKTYFSIAQRFRLTNNEKETWPFAALSTILSSACFLFFFFIRTIIDYCSRWQTPMAMGTRSVFGHHRAKQPRAKPTLGWVTAHPCSDSLPYRWASVIWNFTQKNGINRLRSLYSDWTTKISINFVQITLQLPMANFAIIFFFLRFSWTFNFNWIIKLCTW